MTEDTENRKAEIIDTLTAGIAQLTSSADWKSWLDVQSRFHRYSFQNTLLIQLQRPDATSVAGFNTWRRMGRMVRKGEKGIAILAPVVRRTRVEDEDGEKRTIVGSPSAFRVAHVFDLAQTDGRELPEAPVHRLEGDDTDRAFLRLMKVAAGIGYSVEFAEFSDDRNGDCTPGEQRIRVRQGLAPAQCVKTLAHELAHAILHSDENCHSSRPLAELEAESTAYVVCAAIGLDSGDYTFGYVAGWAGGGDQAIAGIKAAGANIHRASNLILSQLEAADVAALSAEAA